MIVEEKDALDVFDHVAEEVVIDEVNDDDDQSGANDSEAHILSENPFKNYVAVESESASVPVQPESDAAVSSQGHDNNDGSERENAPETMDLDPSPSTAASAAANSTQDSEPIYLSDSLSCFDSDSEAQHEDLDYAITQHKVEVTRKSAYDRFDDPSDQQSNAIDEMDALNLSTDDVIIVQQDYNEPIDVDQSDSEDERFASKYAFEPFVESDSQPTSDVTISKCDDSVDSNAKRNVSVATAVAGITATSSFDDTTSDADDDSSEIDRRGTRSRRDNVVRKNYSTRRTYTARRKLKSDAESPISKNELNHETKNQQGSDDNELKNGESTLRSQQLDDRLNNCLTATETATENELVEDDNALNVMVTKAPPRTYVGKKGAPPKLASCNNSLNSATEPTSPTEESVIAPNDNCGNRSSRSSSNESKAKSTATVAASNAMPRKRGRPRKNASTVEMNESKPCETTDENVAKPEIQSATNEIDEPAESVNQKLDTAKSKKSNQCRAKANANDTAPIHTQIVYDRECQVVICKDELDSIVSSTGISTACVQQSSTNDKSVMTKTEESDQSVEACKTSDDNDIDAMDTMDCTETKPISK